MLLEDIEILSALDDRVVELCVGQPSIVPFLFGLPSPISPIRILPRRHVTTRHERDVLSCHAHSAGFLILCHLEWFTRWRRHSSARMLRYGGEASADMFPHAFELHQMALSLRRRRTMPFEVRWPDDDRPLKVVYSVRALDDYDARRCLREGPDLISALTPAMKGGTDEEVLEASLFRLSNLSLPPWDRRRTVALHRALAELSSVPETTWIRIAMSVDPTLLHFADDDPVIEMLAQLKRRYADTARAEGLIEGRAEGREEGREEGSALTRRGIARALLARGEAPASVALICDLPLEVVHSMSE